MKLEIIENPKENIIQFTVIIEEEQLKFDKCCLCGKSLVGDRFLVFMCHHCWDHCHSSQKYKAMEIRDPRNLGKQFRIAGGLK